MPLEPNARKGSSQTPHANQSSPELFAHLAKQVIRLGAAERTLSSPPNPEPHMASVKAALVANAEALLAIMDRTPTGIAGSHATGEGNAPHHDTNPAFADSSSGSLSISPAVNV